MENTERSFWKLATICCFIVLFHASFAYAWQGKVTSVSDGSTITAMHEGQAEKVRLYGVYSPEKRQDFAEKARFFTSSQVYKKVVDIRPLTKDQYGRTVGLVYVGEKCLNEEVVKSGFAWVYTEYCTEPFCQYLLHIEEEARNRKAGLWAGINPIAPWEFRPKGKAAQVEYAAIYSEPNQRIEAFLYHGSTANHLFHAPGCKDYDCKSCIVVFNTRESAEKAGYKPCPLCLP